MRERYIKPKVTYFQAILASLASLSVFTIAKVTGFLPTGWFSSEETNDRQLAKRAEEQGSGFVINTGLTNGIGNSPAVDSFTDGSFVVAWSLTTELGIFARTYDGSGNPLGPEYPINTDSTLPADSNPQVSVIDDDTFAVSFLGGQADAAYLQSFNKTGTPVSIVSLAYADCPPPCVTISALNNNRLVMVYRNIYLSGLQITSSQFALNGTLLVLNQQISLFTGSHPAITELVNGNYVIAWDNVINNVTGIYANQFANNSTTRLFPVEFQINTYANGIQAYPKLASRGNNGYVVVWQSYGQDGDGYGIFGRLYSLTGAAQGPVFQVNTATAGNQTLSDVAGFPDGSFMVVWQDDTTNNNITGVFGQRFGSNGLISGSGFQINAVSSAAYSPAIAPLLNSGCIVVYASGNGDITGKRVIFYSPTLLNNNFTLTGNIRTLFTSAMLDSSDPYTPNSQLMYDLVNLTTGYIEDINNPGQAIVACSKQQIMNKEIAYNPAGSLYTPSFSFYVRNPVSTIGPFIANINFIPYHYPPVLAVNQMAMIEGQTVFFNSGNLKANSVYNNSNFTYTLVKISYGQAGMSGQFVNQSLQFTQTQLDNISIQFWANGGKNKPGYWVILCDDVVCIPPAEAAVNFLTVHNKPQMLTARMSIVRGGTVIFNPGNINTTGDNVSFDQLQLIPVNVLHGLISRVGISGVVLSNFTQLQVNQGDEIQITHDGSPQATSLSLFLNDGTYVTGPFSMSVSFDQGNFSNSPGTSATSVTTGAVLGVCGIGAVLGSTLFGKVLWDRYTRSKELLANFFRDSLGLQGVRNFRSALGKKYVSMIKNELIPELEKNGYEIATMSPEKLKKLADKLAKVAKNKISYGTTCCGSSDITVDQLSEYHVQIIQGLLNGEYKIDNSHTASDSKSDFHLPTMGWTNAEYV